MAAFDMTIHELDELIADLILRFNELLSRIPDDECWPPATHGRVVVTQSDRTFHIECQCGWKPQTESQLEAHIAESETE